MMPKFPAVYVRTHSSRMDEAEPEDEPLDPEPPEEAFEPEEEPFEPEDEPFDPEGVPVASFAGTGVSSHAASIPTAKSIDMTNRTVISFFISLL